MMPMRVRRLQLAVFVCGSWLTAVAHAQPVLDTGVAALAGDGSWLDQRADHLSSSGDRRVAQPVGVETDAVRLVLVGFGAAPRRIRISTRHANGLLLDPLAEPTFTPAPCPPGSAPGPCWSTPPLRLDPDRLDRDYAAVHERSLEAELGGELQVESASRVLARWRVGAPRSPVFAGIGRLSLKLRVRVLRLTPGGAPSIGGDSGAALSLARNEVLAASKLWAQCGIDLQGPSALDIQVVDPPPIELVAIGCDAGLPASGGRVSLRV